MVRGEQCSGSYWGLVTKWRESLNASPAKARTGFAAVLMGSTDMSQT